MALPDPTGAGGPGPSSSASLPQSQPWSPPPPFPPSQSHAQHQQSQPYPMPGSQYPPHSHAAYPHLAPPAPNAPPHIRNQYYQQQDFFAAYPGHQGPGAVSGNGNGATHGVGSLAQHPGQQSQGQGGYYAPGQYGSAPTQGGGGGGGGPGPGTMQQMQMTNGFSAGAGGAAGSGTGHGSGAGVENGSSGGAGNPPSSGLVTQGTSGFPNGSGSSSTPSATDYGRPPFSPTDSYASHPSHPSRQQPDYRQYPPHIPPYYPLPAQQHLAPMQQGLQNLQSLALQHPQHPQHQMPQYPHPQSQSHPPHLPHQNQSQHQQQPHIGYANMYPPGHPYAYGDGFGYVNHSGPGAGAGVGAAGGGGAYAPMGYGWGMGYGGPSAGSAPGYPTSGTGYDAGGGADIYGAEMSGYGPGPGAGSGAGSSSTSTGTGGPARVGAPRAKGLNPAAQGFSFIPSSSSHSSFHSLSQPLSNSPAEPHVQSSASGMPSATQNVSEETSGGFGLPNGHAAEPGAGDSSLGLSGMAPSSSANPDESLPSTTTTLTTTASTAVNANAGTEPPSSAAPDTSSTVSTFPRLFDTSNTPQLALSQTTDPESVSDSTADAKWTFTGPLVPGYTSPTVPSTVSPSAGSIPTFPSIAQTLPPSASSSSSTPAGSASGPSSQHVSGLHSSSKPQDSGSVARAGSSQKTQTNGASVSASASGSKQTLQLVPSRPAQHATAHGGGGVYISATTRSSIPVDVLAQMDDLTTSIGTSMAESQAPVARPGKRGRKEPSKRKRIFSTDKAYPSTAGSAISFGSVTSDDLDVLRQSQPVPSLSDSASSTAPNTVPAPTPTSAAPAKPPPPKPTSWAGLFKASAVAGGSGAGSGRTFGRAISMPAHILSPGTLRAAGLHAPQSLGAAGRVGLGEGSSGIVSPTMSQLSLATGTGTGTGSGGFVDDDVDEAMQDADARGEETPRSGQISLEAQTQTQQDGPNGSLDSHAQAGPSTSRPAQRKPPAPFNYAAAAALGASMTPQEELARLLTDGLKGVATIGTATAAGIKGKEREMIVPRGLINTGNMCFANTILQVLVYCPPFAELFEELGKRLKADLARRTPLLEAMIIFLREFAPGPALSSSAPSGVATPNGVTSGTSTPRTKRDPRREAFVPENVYDAMKENKRFDSMRRGFQEDAEEYLGFFLNTLHEELLYLLSRLNTSSLHSRSASVPRANGSSAGNDENRIQRPVSPGADNDGDGWLEVGKKQKTNVVRVNETRESAVSRLFGGTLRSVLHTPGQKDSVTLEPYQPLQLDIQPPQVRDITDALRHLSEPEVVGGVWSQTRRENVDATKQVYIETFPPVLILHLKRFVYDPREQTVVKERKPVAYGQELQVPGECISPTRRSVGETKGDGQAQGHGRGRVKYRLFGVVYHHGNSASGGHYTLCVARQGQSGSTGPPTPAQAGKTDPHHSQRQPQSQAQTQSSSQVQAQSQGWIHFDDDLVTPVPGDQVTVSPEEADTGRVGQIGGREKTAYLLFYQRVRS